MTRINIAEGLRGLPDKDTMLSMSGLAFMEAMRDGSLPHAPIAGTMNLRLVAVAPGEVAFRGIPSEAHLNPMGGVHGGWFGTILDSALGCAVMTALPRGAWYTTLEYKVNMVRALAPGVEVEARARLRHAGRSTAVADATLSILETDKLCATASTTCMVMHREPAAAG